MYAGVYGCLHTYMWAQPQMDSSGTICLEIAKQTSGLANKPQGPACLCDLPAFALLASGPRACTTEPVGLCFVVWFGMGSGD